MTSPGTENILSCRAGQEMKRKTILIYPITTKSGEVFDPSKIFVWRSGRPRANIVQRTP